MEAKGSAVISVKEFVKKKYPTKFDDWREGLVPGSKEIYGTIISAGKWYPLHESVVLPTKQVGDKYFARNTKRAAWEMGRFSAEMGLTGMYKVFLMVAKPAYIIGRAGRVFANYYRPIQLDVVSKSDYHVTLHMTNCQEASDVLEWRIGGWMEKALEMCGCKGLRVDITKSITRKDALTEYTITWE